MEKADIAGESIWNNSQRLGMKEQKRSKDPFLVRLTNFPQPGTQRENDPGWPEDKNEEFIQSEERYRRLVELSPDMVLLHSRGKYAYVNPAAVKILGASGPEDLIGKNVLEIVHPEFREVVKERIKYLEKGEAVSLLKQKYLRLDGAAVDVEVAAAPLLYQGQPMVLVVARDITERKRTEEALRMAQFSVEQAGVIIFWVRPDGSFLSANDAACQSLGYPREELLSMSVTDIAPYFQPSQWPERWKEMKERHSISFEACLRRRGGQEFPAEINVNYLEFNGREYMFAFVRDITERKETEKALRTSEEKYRTLVENATDAIFIIQDEMIKFPNPKALSLSGYSAEELSRIPFIRFIHPDDRGMVLDRYRKGIQGERVPRVQTYRCLNKAGEEVWVQINSVPIAWEGRPAALNFLRDVTLEKKLEAQFQTAQKMEAIGTLAGGIAHDFNNLLMGIQGYVSLMLFDIGPSHPFYETLKKVEEQVKSGANLASQLLAFARRGKYEVKPSDLNRLIQHTSAMFGRTKKEIKINGKYQEKIWAVEMDRGQIEQVLLNLYVNAWQAMPEGGDLYLETRNVILGRDYIKPFTVQPGDYVRISVMDTGTGMDKKTQQRIFEPFFTTKEMGRGTGLGLASVYGIVKNHGGFINVYSEIGHGTAFHIYLPACEKKIVGEKKLSAEIRSGTETILLVDDENTITEVIGKALTLTGYKVLPARGGQEAIEVYQKNQNRIDLVVLDMIMPGVSGGRVFDQLREMNPKVKVILSSGYSIDGEASQIMARGCNGFIQKPFGIKELSQKIREVLEKQQITPNE